MATEAQKTAIRYSIVIPAYNAEADLAAVLEAALRDGPVNGELIVADDGSTDATRDIAARYPVQLLTQEKNAGPASARNTGVRHSRGRILVFLDADTEAAGGTVAALVRRLEDNPQLAAVFGSYDDTPLAPTLVSQFRNLLHHYVHHRANPNAVTFWTGCGAVRREAFEKAGGFDEKMRALEDVDLGLRLAGQGYRILLDPSIQVKHRKQWTLWSMIRTDIRDRALPWMRLMRGRRQTISDHGERRTDQWSALALLLLVPAILAGWWRAIPLLLSAATLISTPWHRFVIQKRGFGFALRAVPLHWLYLTYGASCYVYMRSRFLLGLN